MIDMTNLEDILDIEEENDSKILSSAKPIIDFINKSVKRLSENINTNQIEESINESMLLISMVHDVKTLIESLTYKNIKHSIDSAEEEIDFNNVKSLIDNLVNKYNNPDLAKTVYESYKESCISNDDINDNEIVAAELAELEKLLK